MLIQTLEDKMTYFCELEMSDGPLWKLFPAVVYHKGSALPSSPFSLKAFRKKPSLWLI